MTVQTRALLDAASYLQRYLMKEHFNGKALEGPDSGVRFNARIWRFIKSYLYFLPWIDSYEFMQTQGYWILANWRLADLLGNKQFGKLALACAEYVASTQQPEGHWKYPPVPSRKGKIATVEGNFAAIGLLESYRRTKQEYLLSAATKWHRFLVDNIGFQEIDDRLAINYWASSPSGMVPNNTSLTLWVLAELADASNDVQYLAPCEAMVAFLDAVQMENGELPYAVASSADSGRPHFLCFQYNAFEFLDLVHYYGITSDQSVWPILGRLATFLSQGVSESGAARYDCYHDGPEVLYYTAAVAAALSQATALGIANFGRTVDQAYSRVLAQQKANGGMEFFSKRNYGFLTDRRPYPRNLAMVLYHLIIGAQSHSAQAEHGALGF
jgi:hypothetical protein